MLYIQHLANVQHMNEQIIQFSQDVCICVFACACVSELTCACADMCAGAGAWAQAWTVDGRAWVCMGMHGRAWLCLGAPGRAKTSRVCRACRGVTERD